MIRGWAGFVSGCCLLIVMDGLDMNCHAAPRQEQVGSAPSETTDTRKTSGEEPGSTGATTGSQTNAKNYNYTLGPHLLRDFVDDQKTIWTSPSHLRLIDADWLVPLGGALGAMLATDTETSKHLSNSANRIKYSKDVANYGVGSLVAVGGGLYLWGHFTHDDHKRETGLLAGEAAINSLAATYAVKYAFGRERPLEDSYRGRFWQGGVSFPSEHSAAAWSIASVIAHEYPSPLMTFLSYGMAAAVSASRVTGKQHFPSDALLGSAIGWFVGQEVYRHHHDPSLGGRDWKTYAESRDEDLGLGSSSVGSPYVELDSWIYPALERLGALGYVDDEILGMRPWTRSECARLVDEAQDEVSLDYTASSETQQLVDTLEQEFASDSDALGGSNRRLSVESAYTRFTGISGRPLTDSHFGRTIPNDYGRPFSEGFSNVTGFSGWASAGRFAVYVRGEYQHAPSIPPLSDQARQVIPILDGSVTVPPAAATPAVNHVQLLDTYVAMNLENWQLSFGKQSLLWGPSEDGPLMFSNNAVPVTMFRINRVSPVRLPWILGLMGPLRGEFFLGRLSGHEFVFGASSGLVGQWGRALSDQPFIDGLKLSFKPTPNFEFGVDYTTVVGGNGMPFTFHKFVQSLFSLGNGPYGSHSDPGDRRSGVNFSYKIPKMRRWLALYGEAFTEDEFSPLAYPGKSAFQGGIYMPQIPGIPKLDLRVEGGSTAPVDFPACNGCFYNNGRYPNSYTNDDNLMGSWLGRASQGEQAWATYWLTSRNKIQFNYRHRKIDRQSIPNGGTVNDGGMKADVWLSGKTELSGSLQYEKWGIPVLAPKVQSNVTASFQLTFWPHQWK
jgi:Capsule assembly protein Wzi/PAP2 superfamily